MTNQGGRGRSSGSAPLVALSIASFLVYNANLRSIPSGDTLAASLLPFSLLLEGDLDLDEFRPHFEGTLTPDETRWYLRERDGRAFSVYPVLLPLLITPIYAPAVSLCGLRGAPTERVLACARVMEKLAASSIATLAVAMLFLVARRMFGAEGRPLVLALAFAFGTSIWSSASQALWQHGLGCLLVLSALYCFARADDEGGKPAWMAACGLAAALAFASRPSHGIFALALAACVAVRWWRRPDALAAFALGPLLVAPALVWYNLDLFGRVTGGYPLEAARGDLGVGLPGILVSASRGLFVYSPFLLFSIGGIASFLGGRMYRGRPVLGAMLVALLANLLLVGNHRQWWGGGCYGPRVLTDVVPFLVLFLPFVWNRIAGSRIARPLFAASVAASILVHGIGAFCYPKGDWDGSPVSVDSAPERVWDLGDSQIVRAARAGIATEPYRSLATKLGWTGGAGGGESREESARRTGG